MAADNTIVDHEQRITRIEMQLEINIKSLVARIETLEAREIQREKIQQQNERSEMARLRQIEKHFEDNKLSSLMAAKDEKD